MSVSQLLVVLLLFSGWAVFVLRSAVVSLYQTGKTETELLKMKKAYSFAQILFLVHVRDVTAGTPKYNRYRKRMERILKVYLFFVLGIFVLSVIAIVAESILPFLSVVVLLKLFFFDFLYVGSYLFFNSNYDKVRKAFRWKWTK